MTKDEEIKLNHTLSLLAEGYADFSTAVWDILGESSYAFTRVIGQDALKRLENDYSLKVEGKPIETLLSEIGKLYVEEYGFMKNIQVEAQDHNKIVVKVEQCRVRRLCDKMIASGVKKPIQCQIMGTCAAALERSGYKMRNDIEKWVEEDGSIITFTNINA